MKTFKRKKKQVIKKQVIKKQEEKMKTLNRKAGMMALLLTGVLWVFGSGTALAFTEAGEPINNVASVLYDVGGTTQAPIASTGTDADFWVDHMVDLTVTKDADATVAPLSTDQVLKFTLTNTGNKDQSYALTAIQDASKTFDMGAVAIYVDNGNGTWDGTGTETLYTDATDVGTITHDGTNSVVIWLEADTPAAADTEIDPYWLVAQATEAGTVNTLTASGGNVRLGEDIVFVDADGDGAGVNDVVTDSIHSAMATYTVGSATITITKTNSVLGGGFAIPGATVTYEITVSHTAGSTAATDIVVTDSLVTEIATNGTLAFNTLFADADKTCVAGQGMAIKIAAGAWTCLTNADDTGVTDESNFAANIVTVGGPLAGISISAGESAIIRFQVTIQ